jgi:hypothetical protein
VNYFQVGESCGGYAGEAPLERVKVKDLRRAGLGHLAVADLNHDGWVDDRDIAHYLEFGAPRPDAPVLGPGPR